MSKSTRDIYHEVIAAIARHQNGANASSMNIKGVDYKLNHGIITPHLKMIAQKFEKNHELASMLWKSNSREAKIMASLLDIPESITKEQMNSWATEFENQELMQQVVFNCFAFADISEKIAIEWINSPKEYLIISGFFLLARRCRLKYKLKAESIEEAIKKCNARLEKQNQQLIYAITYFVRELIRIHPDYIYEANTTANKLTAYSLTTKAMAKNYF